MPPVSTAFDDVCCQQLSPQHSPNRAGNAQQQGLRAPAPAPQNQLPVPAAAAVMGKWGADEGPGGPDGASPLDSALQQIDGSHDEVELRRHTETALQREFEGIPQCSSNNPEQIRSIIARLVANGSANHALLRALRAKAIFLERHASGSSFVQAGQARASTQQQQQPQATLQQQNRDELSQLTGRAISQLAQQAQQPTQRGNPYLPPPLLRGANSARQAQALQQKQQQQQQQQRTDALVDSKWPAAWPSGPLPTGHRDLTQGTGPTLYPPAGGGVPTKQRQPLALHKVRPPAAAAAAAAASDKQMSVATAMAMAGKGAPAAAAGSQQLLQQGRPAAGAGAARVQTPRQQLVSCGGCSNRKPASDMHEQNSTICKACFKGQEQALRMLQQTQQQQQQQQRRQQPLGKAGGRRASGRAAKAGSKDAPITLADTDDDEDDGGGDGGGGAPLLPPPATAAAAAAAAAPGRRASSMRSAAVAARDAINLAVGGPGVAGGLLGGGPGSTAAKYAGLSASYPPGGGRGAVLVRPEDLAHLDEDEFLNDTIMDYYAKRIECSVPPDQAGRFHFFNSFFYKKLTEKEPGGVAGPDLAPRARAERNHARVRNWTKGVNIFACDYLFIPIHDVLHWSLLIVAHPNNLHRLLPAALTKTLQQHAAAKAAPAAAAQQQQQPETAASAAVSIMSKVFHGLISLVGGSSGSQDAQQQPQQQPGAGSSSGGGGAFATPCLIHLDSMKGGHPTPAVVAAVRDYLEQEWLRQTSERLGLSHGRLSEAAAQYVAAAGGPAGGRPGSAGSSKRLKDALFVPPSMRATWLPQQDNHCDCGLFVLTYLDYFVAAAPPDIRHADLAAFKTKHGGRRVLPPGAELRLSPQQPHLLMHNWFDAAVASCLRGHLRGQLLRLMLDQASSEVRHSDAGAAAAAEVAQQEEQQAEQQRRLAAGSLRSVLAYVPPDTFYPAVHNALLRAKDRRDAETRARDGRDADARARAAAAAEARNKQQQQQQQQAASAGAGAGPLHHHLPQPAAAPAAADVAPQPAGDAEMADAGAAEVLRPSSSIGSSSDDESQGDPESVPGFKQARQRMAQQQQQQQGQQQQGQGQRKRRHGGNASDPDVISSDSGSDADVQPAAAPPTQATQQPGSNSTRRRRQQQRRKQRQRLTDTDARLGLSTEEEDAVEDPPPPHQQQQHKQSTGAVNFRDAADVAPLHPASGGPGSGRAAGGGVSSGSQDDCEVPGGARQPPASPPAASPPAASPPAASPAAAAHGGSMFLQDEPMWQAATEEGDDEDADNHSGPAAMEVDGCTPPPPSQQQQKQLRVALPAVPCGCTSNDLSSDPTSPTTVAAGPPPAAAAAEPPNEGSPMSSSPQQQQQQQPSGPQASAEGDADVALACELVERMVAGARPNKSLATVRQELEGALSGLYGMELHRWIRNGSMKREEQQVLLARLRTYLPERAARERLTLELLPHVLDALHTQIKEEAAAPGSRQQRQRAGSGGGSGGGRKPPAGAAASKGGGCGSSRGSGKGGGGSKASKAAAPDPLQRTLEDCRQPLHITLAAGRGDLGTPALQRLQARLQEDHDSPHGAAAAPAHQQQQQQRQLCLDLDDEELIGAPGQQQQQQQQHEVVSIDSDSDGGEQPAGAHPQQPQQPAAPVRSAYFTGDSVPAAARGAARPAAAASGLGKQQQQQPTLLQKKAAIRDRVAAFLDGPPELQQQQQGGGMPPTPGSTSSGGAGGGGLFMQALQAAAPALGAVCGVAPPSAAPQQAATARAADSSRECSALRELGQYRGSSSDEADDGGAAAPGGRNKLMDAAAAREAAAAASLQKRQQQHRRQAAALAAGGGGGGGGGQEQEEAEAIEILD